MKERRRMKEIEKQEIEREKEREGRKERWRNREGGREEKERGLCLCGPTEQ